MSSCRKHSRPSSGEAHTCRGASRNGSSSCFGTAGIGWLMRAAAAQARRCDFQQWKPEFSWIFGFSLFPPMYSRSRAGNLMPFGGLKWTLGWWAGRLTLKTINKKTNVNSEKFISTLTSTRIAREWAICKQKQCCEQQILMNEKAQWKLSEFSPTLLLNNSPHALSLHWLS